MNTSEKSSNIDIAALTAGKSAQLLLAELEEVSANSELDVELIEAYLAALQAVQPIDAGRDVEQALADFKSRYADIYADAIQPKQRRKSRPRRWRTIGAVAVIMLVVALMFVPVDVQGGSLFALLVKWGDEQVSFTGVRGGGTMQLKPESGAEYYSLEEVFDASGLSAVTYPTWVPTRFSLDYVSVEVSDSMAAIAAIFLAGEDKIIFSLVQMGGVAGSTVIEKDPGETVYVRNGREYTLFTNAGVPTAAWYDDDYVYALYGDVTMQEMKKILNSVVERKEQ